MALTSTQKSQVRRYLGYPDVNRQWHSEIEGAMTSLSTEGETFVGALLTSLEAIQTKLSGSWDRQKVHVVEDITLAGHDEIEALRAEGNRLATDLGVVFGVPPRRLPFSSSSGTGFVLQRG
jgi:hypothetical protein